MHQENAAGGNAPENHGNDTARKTTTRSDKDLRTDGGTDLTNPGYGTRVTYYDADGGPHPALVLEPLPGDTYITLAWADADPDVEYVGTGWTVETSVVPHADCGEEWTATRYAFKPGWEA